VNKSDYLSPTELLASADKKILFVAQHTGNRIDFVDVATFTISGQVALPESPTGMALSKDGSTLYVTTGSDNKPMGSVYVIDIAQKNISDRYPAGHYPRSPVLNSDGSVLYICNWFENVVSLYDIGSKKKTGSIPVVREPYSAALTPDGKYLVVANYLPVGRADLPLLDTKATIGSSVSIINTLTKSVESNIELVNGSHSISDVCITDDGKYAYVTHVLARYTIPPTKIEQGWIGCNTFSVIDIPNKKLVNTVLIDDANLGAANPWKIRSARNKIFLITAGSHELMIFSEQSVLNTLLNSTEDLSYKFAFGQEYKTRLKLSVRGPRALEIIGDTAYVAGYFSDELERIGFTSSPPLKGGILSMSSSATASMQRKGEELFYDSDICLQKWLSCHSCHPHVRTDALNWDLLNDGIGNSKNVKSMLLAHRTPPSMSLGVRTDATVAVRAGIQYILFSEPREEDAIAIDTYLKSLQQVPSPYLVKGQLSEMAKRGAIIFNNKLQCKICHPAPLYTDLKFHDVGSKGVLDQTGSFDTPTLREVWRTAPYMHDGKYATLRDLFKTGKHGLIENVTDSEIDDLVEFVNSL
jgi:hypothetical protein